MTQNIFSPRFRSMSADTLSAFFMRGARLVFAVVMGLLPLWFVPEAVVSFGLIKTIFVVFGLYLTGIFAVLSILRSGKVHLCLPLPLVFFWGYALSAVVSALLSGDIYDSLYGVSLDLYSAGFALLLAFLMTLGLVFAGGRSALIKLLALSSVVVVGVYAFSLLRIFFGTDFLNFGVFTSDAITLVGSLNDLALYAGLVLVTILVSVQSISDSLVARSVVSLITLFSLLILAVVNFSFIWVCLGFLSLLIFLYLIARDTWLKSTEDIAPVSHYVLSLVALICVFSGVFVVSGDYLGSRVSDLTGINYLEVRPSFDATTAIAKQVYHENVLTGIGANRFDDAWRLFKSDVINETQFWNTNFVSGNNFVYTIFINTGMLGGVFFLTFFVLFIWLGYRLLVNYKATTGEDWGLVGKIVFSAALYLWVMTFWYTPGVTTMFLASLFTGLTLAVARSMETPKSCPKLDVTTSRQHGFLLIAVVLVFIVSTTIGLIAINKQYFAQANLATEVKLAASAGNQTAYDAALAKAALTLPHNDIYPAERARIRLSELSRLLTVAAPTTEDQQTFEQSLVEGVKLAEEAVLLDPTNPYNYALLGSFYGVLNPSEYEGVAEQRAAAFAEARRLDPQNPEYNLIEAQIARRFGETELARTKVTEALAQKNTYAEALLIFSQLEIEAGNATSAIAATESMIILEPYNPGRRYQLGLLKYATGDLEAAAISFGEALDLDDNYANARYMLALVYLDLNLKDEALAALRKVQETNRDNESLRDLIAQVESGNFANPGVAAPPVSQPSTAVEGAEAAVTTTESDTDLVSPLNRTVEGEITTSPVVNE